MVITIITSNNNSNNSNKVDLYTEQHHRKKKKKQTNKLDLIKKFVRQTKLENYFIVNVTNTKWKC